MFNFIADLLSWFYTIWPSYGGAIILLTLLIMVVLAPLTVKQTKSMLSMAKLQPEVKRLRSKYGDDREALNQELMALYQANGVNPLGGCLPMLVQMPVLLVLYQIMRGLTRRVSGIGLRAGEAVTSSREAGLTELDKRGFNPAYISEDSSLYESLTEPGRTEMKSVGLDLAQSVTGAFSESAISAIPYLLLVIGIGISTWYQQRLVRNRSTGEMNPQQQAIMKYLPFMLPIFSLGFPAALVLYWLVSNLFRSGQQLFITKKFYGSNNDDDDTDIIRPDSQLQDDVDDSVTTRKPKPQRAKADSGNLHGSRPPVSGGKPKKKKPPPSKRTTEPARERNPRTTSKRVTPKKSEREAIAAAPESTRKSKWQERLERQKEAAEEKATERKKRKGKK